MQTEMNSQNPSISQKEFGFRKTSSSHNELTPLLIRGAGDEEQISFIRSRSAPTLAGKAMLYPVGRQSIRVAKAPVLPVFAGSPAKGYDLNERMPAVFAEESLKCTITTWEAYFSCINLYVGLSLLSMGYAMMVGGWMQVITLGLVMAFGNYTGLVMVLCFAKFPGRDISYEKLGMLAMGTLGPKWGKVGWGMVAFAITVEFIGLTACAIVFLFRHVALLITGVPFWIVAVGCVCATIPTVFLLNFAQMSIWSIIGTFTSIASAASCILIFLYDIDRFYENTYPVFSLNGTGVSAGIFLYALAGHAALPAIYNCMENQNDFKSMVNGVFLTMFILYVVCAFCCLFTFGTDIDVLVTHNYAMWPGGIFITFLIVIIIIKLISLVPANVNVMSEIPENYLGITKKPNSQRLFRLCIYLLCAVIGWVMRDSLDILEAVTGAGCTMATSVIFPIMFYLLLYWKQLSKISKICNCLLFAISCLLTIWFLYQDLAKCISEDVAYDQNPSSEPYE